MNFFFKFTRYRKPLLVAADFVQFSLSYFAAWFILMRRISLAEHLPTVLFGYLFFIVIFLVVYWIFGMYESLWRYAEAYEFLKCMIAIVVAVSVFVAVTWLVFQPPRVEYRLPITVYFISAAMAGASTLFFRAAYRAYRASSARQRGGLYKKALVVGASETAVALIQGLERNPSQRYEVLCAVDDDASKVGLRISQRVRIAGTINDIPRLVKRQGIQVILLAVPHASGKEKRRISSICAKTNCELKKVPDIFDFESGDRHGAAVVSRTEDVSVEDLLGRDVVDIKRFRDKYLAGQTVLVTGAGGTIGSELCRQAAAHGAALIVLVDVWENGMYELEQELKFKFGGKVRVVAEVANVREAERLDRLFAMYKPSLVYHAAAHKHVTLMETAPEEAVKNNIFGTLNVVCCAERFGVKRFVLVSTDKAVNPTNVYGATKRVCEMIVQSVGFASVRFGNVLGSNGSVIPLFKAQIAAGGPVCVTHREIIRYYMTVSEAVSLVMSAGEMAKGGEIFVLDMGEPVKTLDLAEMLIRLSGYEPYEEIDIEFTGLRPGEKLYEELLMAEEGLKTTSNNKIFVGKKIEIEPEVLFASLEELRKFANEGARDEIVKKLHELVPGFTSGGASV